MKKNLLKLLGALSAATTLGTAIAADHHHHHLVNDVEAFHAVLAPIWHARPSPERLPNACAKVDEMRRLSSDIRSTNPSNLSVAIAAMKIACQSNLGDVDGAFYDVHEAFHQLLDAKTAGAKR